MAYTRDQYRTGQHALSEEEVQKMLTHTEDLVTYVALKIAVTTGIRREDLAALKWKDIDIERAELSFYENKKRRTWTVQLSPNVIADLKRLRNQYPNEHYILPGRAGKIYGKGHLTGRTLWNRFNEALDRASISRRPFHSLRATCIKLCEKKGWSEAQTAALVGDTVQVIQEHYKTPSLSEMKTITKEKSIL